MNKVERAIEVLNKELDFQFNRLTRLEQRREQILHDVMMGYAVHSPISVQRELAQMDEKIKQCQKHIDFVQSVLDILKEDEMNTILHVHAMETPKR